ncbi:hypothetical protein [Bradyrhizobium ivorense]|uniref:hypothetical protein n=1 Tax=Bradyrhizobium ivorense TaxID=2511166 RepID=UPI00155B3B1D|nr:hypothetical protein [Bradyrhizobium ivorense]
MDTAVANSAAATECAKHFRVALVEHLIQKDIAGLDAQAYCSSEHVADLITLPRRITDIDTNILIPGERSPDERSDIRGLAQHAGAAHAAVRIFRPGEMRMVLTDSAEAVANRAVRTYTLGRRVRDGLGPLKNLIASTAMVFSSPVFPSTNFRTRCRTKSSSCGLSVTIIP